jgi:NADH-quinone oxidoreductase subunit N
MRFSKLVDNLIEETFQKSLGMFSPELALCATIVVLLLVRLANLDHKLPAYWIALVGSICSFILAFLQFDQLIETEVYFSGMLVYDQFTVFLRLFLLVFLILVIALTVISGIPDTEDGPDFYTLLLGATIGMMMMAGANHLLMLFLGIEMTSVPSYVMVGFLKGRRLSSEAALKYVVYGAGAAGVMLYGTSLLAGLLGTGDLTLLAARLNELFLGEEQLGLSNPMVRTVVLGALMVMVGLAFKLSLVPFHFWCPDAFEGASAEVAGFLSVAPKAAAFALLVRFTLALVGDGTGALADVYVSLGIGLGIVGAVSATFGNLAAYAQNNMKRLLAYSTIAHAGYMLMAVAAMVVILNSGGDPVKVQSQAATCLEGLMFYLAVYLFMNLGAFAIVALIRNEIHSEEIKDYAGIGRQVPILGIGMVFCMFSLVGMPPFGGFFAKLIIFSSLLDAGYVHWSMWAVLAVGGLNTVFSLFYYLRVLNVMYLVPRPEDAKPVEIPFNPVGAYVLLVSVPVLLLGFFPFLVNLRANKVATDLFHSLTQNL